MHPGPHGTLMKKLTGACFINALFVPHVSRTCTPEPPGMMIGAAAAGLPKVVKANSEPLFINGRGARESIDDCQPEPPNRPGHRWSLFQASSRCIDEPGVTTRSASMNGVWNPKVHRWMRYERQKCIDEWGVKPRSASMNGYETQSASMNRVWNLKVHRWMGFETQKCIDECGLKPKSASMNGFWNPKVHRWMRYET